MKKILLIQGHPDSDGEHFCDNIAAKYMSAATDAGHKVRHITLNQLNFPLLASRQEFIEGKPPEDILAAQTNITWANHVVMIYPLWFGDMPALVKGFWEQVLRPGFAVSESENGRFQKLLTDKSARIFVTMDMPALVYRWFFKAHSVKSLQRNVLSFCGFEPVKYSLIGGVHKDNEKNLYRELSDVSRLGRLAE